MIKVCSLAMILVHSPKEAPTAVQHVQNKPMDDVCVHEVKTEGKQRACQFCHQQAAQQLTSRKDETLYSKIEMEPPDHP